MNGVVNKLYDIDSIVIPEEMLKADVDEQKVEEALHALSMRYAKESQAEEAAKGDLVYCHPNKDSYPDGRTVLIYTGMNIPGAEQAEEAVIGKKVDDTVLTVLAGKTVGLTVKKILRRTPVEVTDALVAGMELEGVATVEDYRTYLRKKQAEDLKMEQSKSVIRYIMDLMVESSTYSYDQAELEASVMPLAQQYAKECEAMGEPASVEEIKEGLIYQEKQNWMAKAFCESKGIAVDTSSAEEEADRMIEMMQLMGETVPDREEMIQMTVQNMYLDAFFEYVDTLIGKAGEH